MDASGSTDGRSSETASNAPQPQQPKLEGAPPSADAEEREEEAAEYTLLVVGETGAGKSSLINSLVAEREHGHPERVHMKLAVGDQDHPEMVTSLGNDVCHRLVTIAKGHAVRLRLIDSRGYVGPDDLDEHRDLPTRPLEAFTRRITEVAYQPEVQSSLGGVIGVPALIVVALPADASQKTIGLTRDCIARLSNLGYHGNIFLVITKRDRAPQGTRFRELATRVGVKAPFWKAVQCYSLGDAELNYYSVDEKIETMMDELRLELATRAAERAVLRENSGADWLISMATLGLLYLQRGSRALRTYTVPVDTALYCLVTIFVVIAAIVMMSY